MMRQSNDYSKHVSRSRAANQRIQELTQKMKWKCQMNGR